jgi:two-component system, OmpR family, response regulator TctD
MSIAILFVSPSADDARSLFEMLSGMRLPCTHALDLAQASSMLESRAFGAILTEAHLPDGDWRDVVKLVGRMRRRIAVVVTDLMADAHLWADVLDGGAYDLLPKPFCCGEVQRILANALDSPPALGRAASAA